MDLSRIDTENRNPKSFNLDSMSSFEIVSLMNSEDKKVPIAIETELPNISKVVDVVSEAFEKGNRLIYIGAGTSGRLGVLDASECPPTFGVSPDMVVGLIAGGDTALRNAVENAEDNMQLAVKDLQKNNLSSGDVVVGLAASGRTPYVVGGLKFAKKLGCKTASVACTKDSEIGKVADIVIEVVPGPEVLTGSTRLKSGTVQKMVCNMITTGAMVRIGKTYENLMVDVIQSNKKLHVRAENIFIQATGSNRETARHFINKADGKVKIAIVMFKTCCSKSEAINLLKQANGHVKLAVEKG